MIRVLIAEDFESIRTRYETILSEHDEFEVVGSVASGSEAVEAYARYKPDIVLMDIEMETKTAGLNATSIILGMEPQAKIIILTVYENDELVYEAFKLGVINYIVKNYRASKIVSCIIDAYHGASSIDPQIAEKIRREFKRVKISEDHFKFMLSTYANLTQAELEIINMANKGCSRKDISRIRCVEISTIKTQINSILRKYQKNSMAEVIQLLRDNHVLDYMSDVTSMNN